MSDPIDCKARCEAALRILRGDLPAGWEWSEFDNGEGGMEMPTGEMQDPESLAIDILSGEIDNPFAGEKGEGMEAKDWKFQLHSEHIICEKDGRYVTMVPTIANGLETEASEEIMRRLIAWDQQRAIIDEQAAIIERLRKERDRLAAQLAGKQACSSPYGLCE